jgi:hypothetical protein
MIDRQMQHWPECRGHLSGIYHIHHEDCVRLYGIHNCVARQHMAIPIADYTPRRISHSNRPLTLFPGPIFIEGMVGNLDFH